MSTIEDRKENPSGQSYTSSLIQAGVSGIGEKVIEEAREVVEAAHETGAEGRHHLVLEAADLVYHLLVLLSARDVALAQVEAELASRFGVSGLAEKAARNAQQRPARDDDTTPEDG